jgi:tetratricopeptide (TPR) repeat protein
MIKKSLFFISSSLLLLANEPSAFGAGDLNSEKPYGLTATEKYIYENKKKLSSQQDNLEKLKTETKSTATRLQELQSQIDGIKSVVDSEGQKSHSQMLELNKIKDDIKKNSLAVETFDTKVKEVLANQEKLIKSSTENNENIKKAIKELTQIVNKINEDYVTKELFDKLAQDNVNDLKKLEKIHNEDFEVLKKEIQKLKKDIEKKEEEAKMAKKSPQELMDEAKELFDAKEYTKSKAIYEKLVELKHKPARSTFYIAEIEYVNKNYAKALDLYKKSVSMYDKAEYMPELLYHSGVSCMNTKDNKNAISFFETYIKSFPKHQDINKAKKLLSSLKDKK